jgi:hypothetical protein
MKIGILILLLSAATAQAQQSGAPAQQGFGAYGRATAENAMTEFARCVVRGTPDRVVKALATPPGSSEERASFIAIANSRKGCLHQGKLRMKGHWMRGALAEQLYLHRFTAPLAEPANPAAPAPAVAEGDDPYHAYAGCIVARNAPAVDMVMRHGAGSEEERAAFQAAMPALSSCLAGGESNRLRIDRAVLRGYLAEALLDFRNGGAG